MSQDDSTHIDNYLNDITTALPYSDYIRKNLGSYVIIDDKPYVLKAIRFRHTRDDFSPNYHLQCFLSLQGDVDDAYFVVTLSKDIIFDSMDEPMILIDLVNAHLRQKLKFVPKNETTDLLFKNEG